MSFLPDVDQDGYDAYSHQQFADDYQRRIGQLQFGQQFSSKLAELHAMAAPPRMPESAVALPGQLPVPIPGQPQIPSLPQLPMPRPQAPAPPPQIPGPILPSQGRPGVLPQAPGLEEQLPLGEPPPRPPSTPLGPPQRAEDLRPQRAEDLRLNTASGPAWAQPERRGVTPGGAPATDASGMLSRSGVIDYVHQRARDFGLDPAAVLAVANQEGLNTGPGSDWTLQGEGNISFGPPSWYGNGAGAAIIQAHGKDAQRWSWTPEGIDYWLQQVAQAGASGLSGPDAVSAIVHRFERPREDLAAGEVNKALAQYDTFARPGNTGNTANPSISSIPSSSAMGQSQFGDPQLTTDEAYAACGPAAAVRFAQAYGRNPTLREAVDLAKQVGWTSGAGMAGIGSEQQLLRQMGVETKLVAGSQWDKFAAEAQTGNPVTISTANHYFYADGYNPQTGQFHVGRSGTDLRGGAEWMTADQMEGLMGRAQGALFASNPTVQASSTSMSTPQDLGELKDSIFQRLSAPQITPGRTPGVIGPSLPQLDRAVEVAFQPSREQARTPNLNAADSGNPLDNLGSLIGNAIQSALSSALGGSGPPGDRSRDSFAKRAGHTEAQVEDLSLQPWQHTLELRNPVTGEPISNRELGLPDLTPPKDINEAISRATEDALRRSLPSPGPGGQLGILDPKMGSPFENPDNIMGISDVLDQLLMRGKGAERAGRALNAAFSVERALPRASEAIAAGARDLGGRLPGEALGSLLPANTFKSAETPTDEGTVRRILNRLAFEFTDRNLSLAQLQDTAEKALGKPLNPEDMAYFLNRLNPGGRSHVLVDQKLGPISRAAGQHYDSLVDYLTARSNVSTSDAIGNRVMREGADAPISRVLQGNVDRAERELAARQRNLDALLRASDAGYAPGTGGVPTQQELNAAARAVDRAQATLERHQGKADAARQNVLQQASTRGAEVAQNRLYAGGLTKESSQAVLDELQQKLPPEVWDLFHGAGGLGDQFFDFGRDLRNRAVDTGLMSEEEAAQLAEQYPDWFRRHALDYMNDNSARGLPAGQRLGLNDRSLRQYTLEGSAQSIQNPIEGMISYADQLEKMAFKNQAAQALINLDSVVGERQLKQLITPAEYSMLEAAGEDMARYTTDSGGPGTSKLNVFSNGEKQQWVTDNPYYAQAIEGADLANLPTWARGPANFVRMAATSRNPAFLGSNALLDAMTYGVKTAANGERIPGSYGVADLPMITSELLRGYFDAFKGLNPLSTPGGWVGGALGGGAAAATTNQDDPNRGTKIALATALASTLGGHRALTGRFEGENTQRYLLGGGGMAGQYRAFEPKAAAERAAELRRGSMFEVNKPGDLMKLLNGIWQMRWVENVGQRVELAPRVAAMRVAEQRMARAGIENPVKAVMAGREVTMDFDKGGRVVKFMNQFMPFLNAGIQGSANTVRMLKGNPGGSAAAIGSLLIGPTMAAEAWNRSDPQRERDYEDVPQYLKDQGVVIMLPTQAPVDKDGNRHPQYVHINLREFSPFAIAAREAAMKMAGKQDPRSWQQLAGALAMAASPIQANNLSDLGGRFMGLPLADSLRQLATNHDDYRDAPIVTERADQNASNFSKLMTPLLQRGLQTWDPNTSSEIRPSALDFLIRDAAGSFGNELLGASNLGNPPRDTQASNMPIAGGLLSRFMGGTTGERLDEARGAVLTPSARKALRDAGIQWTPSAVTSVAQNIPLRQEEQTKLQQLTNRYMDDAIQKLVRNPNFQKADQTKKERYLSGYTSQAHEKAQNEILRSIPQASRTARRKSGSSKD